MLLMGTAKTTPVPGTSICSRRSNPRRSSRQVSSVTTASMTAFSVRSRPKYSSSSLTAVPEPVMRKWTSTPQLSYRAWKRRVLFRSVMVNMRYKVFIEYARSFSVRGR